MKYVIIKNDVFNISKLTHPGGNFIFTAVNGRSIDRFINGSYPLESSTQSKGYVHSSYASLLISKYKIATIDQPREILSETSIAKEW